MSHGHEGRKHFHIDVGGVNDAFSAHIESSRINYRLGLNDGNMSFDEYHANMERP